MVGALGPDERLWVLVVDPQVLLYRLFQLRGAAVRAAPDLPFGDRRELPFDLVDPRCARGCEAQVEARLASQPIVNHRRLVSAVVVQHTVSPSAAVLAAEPPTDLESVACSGSP